MPFFRWQGNPFCVRRSIRVLQLLQHPDRLLLANAFHPNILALVGLDNDKERTAR